MEARGGNPLRAPHHPPQAYDTWARVISHAGILVFGDLFHREVSGWAKAGWTFAILFFPFLGVLLYLLARPRPSEEAITSHMMRS